jgi:predicted nucleic acid-binding protein
MPKLVFDTSVLVAGLRSKRGASYQLLRLIDARLFRLYISVAHLAPFVPRQRPSLRDPDDERILEVAVQCGATIVTHNLRDFKGAEQFGVLVKTPAEILRILRRSV